MQIPQNPPPGAPRTLGEKLLPWLPLILFTTGLLYIIPLGMYGVLVMDEGVFATGAARVLRGQVPHRDFWSQYPPGQYYLVAGVMKLFGISLGVMRILGALEASAIAMLVFLLAKRVCDWRIALIPWLLSVIWMPTTHLFISSIPGTLCVFAAVYSAILYIEKPSAYKILLSGIFCGLAGVFRQDTFVYALVVPVFTLMMWHRFRPQVSEGDRASTSKTSLAKGLGLFAAGIVAAGGIPAILLLSAAPFSLVWKELVSFSFELYNKVRGGAYPRLHYKVKWLTHYLPFIFLGVAVLLYALRKSWKEHVSLVLFVPMCVLTAVFMLQQLVAPGWHHLTGAMLASLILAGFSVESLRPRSHTAGRIAVFVFFLLFLLYVGWGWVSYRLKHLRGTWALCELERVGLVKVPVPAYEHTVRTARYVQSHTSQDTPLFVGSPRYDMLYINDTMLYFLAGRPPATRYGELHSGVVTTAAIQREIIGALERTRPPYVVIWNGVSHIRVPDQVSISSGVFELQEYIEQHYAHDAEFGDYKVLKRLP